MQNMVWDIHAISRVGFFKLLQMISDYENGGVMKCSLGHWRVVNWQRQDPHAARGTCRVRAQLIVTDTSFA